MRLVATEYLTLDGVMEEPGEWSFDFWSDESAKFKFDELFASDAQLLGRVTYEGFAKAWPTMEDEGGFADRMNNMPKFVVSNTLKDPSWNNTRVLKGNIVEEIKTLKQQPGRDLLLAGSARLFSTLMQHNLIDEYRFMIHPVVLGKGKRLFADGGDKTILKLTDKKSFGSGITVLSYEPAGAPAQKEVQHVSARSEG
jgi:dihydrofolate reductase